MADFYFAVGSDPCDVFVVVGDKWVLYKRCETEEIARVIVDGQNKSRGGQEPSQIKIKILQEVNYG